MTSPSAKEEEDCSGGNAKDRIWQKRHERPPPPSPLEPHGRILAQFHLQNASFICALAPQTDSAASGLHLSLVLLVPEHISPPARQRQFGPTMNHAWQISSLLSVSAEFNRVLYSEGGKIEELLCLLRTFRWLFFGGEPWRSAGIKRTKKGQ